jgi:hypothetical protein
MAVDPDAEGQAENPSRAQRRRESYGPIDLERRPKEDGRALILYETRPPREETVPDEGSTA